MYYEVCVHQALMMLGNEVWGSVCIPEGVQWVRLLCMMLKFISKHVNHEA